MDAIGYGWVTSHVWRKTVATVLDEAGLNLGEIADQLGNTREIVERHYVQKRPTNERAAAALEGVLPTEPKPTEK
jgi:integrase